MVKNKDGDPPVSALDPAFAVALKQGLIGYLQNKRGSALPPRAWILDCRSGEEAYAVSMILADLVATLNDSPDINIFATDSQQSAIDLARGAQYPVSAFAAFPEHLLDSYCSIEDEKVIIRKQLRAKIVFSVLDILRDPPLPKLDFIYAPRALSGLTREARAVVLAKLHFSLQTGGVVCIANAEPAISALNLFTSLDPANHLFKANALSRPHRPKSFITLPEALVPKQGVAPTPPASDRLPPMISTPAAQLHDKLSLQSLPPSILVDENFNIVHIGQGASQFLQHPSGRPTNNLTDLVQQSLQVKLRAALFKAVISGASVGVRHRGYAVGDWVSTMTIMVRPAPANDHIHYLVSFDLLTSILEDKNEFMRVDTVSIQLESEIVRLRDCLQESIEGAMAAEAEQKITFEEAQSENEELRSIIDEIQAGNDHLLSINASLEAINEAFSNKVIASAAAHEDLTGFLDASMAISVLVDEGLLIQCFTKEAMSIFHLRDRDVGRSLLDIRHSLLWPDYERDLSDAISSSISAQREVTHVDGRQLIVRISKNVPSAGALLTFTDVTLLRRAEAEVVATEARTVLLAQTTKDYAIISMDQDGKILSWNVGAEQTFGYNASEMVGQSGALLYAGENVGEDAFEFELQTALVDNKATNEHWHQRKTGERIFCSGVTVALYSDAGHFKGFAKIARDVTKQEHNVRLQEQRLQTEKTDRMASEEANRLKDQFLAIMSHELKHPLNMISLNAELLSNLCLAQFDGKTERALTGIAQAVRSQAKIIDDLLDISRINTGKLRLDIESVDAVATTESVCAAAKEFARAKGVAFSFETAADTMMIQADKVRLEQILWNLITNAIKFTPTDGSIIVRLERDEHHFTLRVIDTGIGLDEAALGGVFNLFAQGESPAAVANAGLGIGLALVKELVEAHGGRVDAVSPGLGHGVTVTVILPLIEQRTQTSSLSMDILPGIAGVKLLIVDDAIDACEALAALFESEGAIIRTATSGKEALIMLGNERFDVLISDVVMADTNGYELIACIRAMDQNADLLTIALTGLPEAAEDKNLIESGFDRQFQKPVLFSALQDAIVGLLKDRPSSYHR